MRLKSVAYLIFFCSVSFGGFAQSPKAIILEMVQSAGEVEGFTAEITKEERIQGKLVKQITAVKLIRKPYQLYLNQQYPKKGVEILCRVGHDKALVNPNSFSVV